MESRLLAQVRELLDVLEQLPGERGDLSQTLQHIARTAQSSFFADASSILAMNPITGHIVETLAFIGEETQGKKKAQADPNIDTLIRETLENGMLVVEDLHAQPTYQTRLACASGMSSLVGLALRMQYQQKPLGILCLYFKRPQHFTSEQLELLQFFAGHASFLLQETWLLRRYGKVARIGQEINHDLPGIDMLFRKLLHHIPGILDVRHAFFLAVYQSQTNTLDLHIQEEGKQIFLPNVPLQGASKYVIETREMQSIRHLSQEAERLPFSLSPIPGTGPKESYIFIPLVLRDVPLGVLSIQHPEPNAFNQDDTLILQLLAIHISLACYNMRLLNRLSQLNETGQYLTEHLDLEQTLQGVVERIQAATRADVVILYRYDNAERRFVHSPRVSGALFDSDPRQMYPARPRDIVRLLLEREQPIFARQSIRLYKELRGDEEVDERLFARRERISSTAAMPLRVKDEPVGILFVNFRQPQRFEESHCLFIEGLAHYAAIAIKNAYMYDRLGERRLHELEILRTIDHELNSSLELTPVLNTILRLGMEQVPADAASILLYDRRRQMLTIPAAVGLHATDRGGIAIFLPESKGISHWVLDNKKPARVDNVHSEPHWRDIYIPTAPETISELDVPLLNGEEEVIGILNFESSREAAFREQDEAFLITLAGQAALAIKNAQAYEREKRLVAEGKVLTDISREITSQLDVGKIFDLILEKALALTKSTSGTLRIYDPAAQQLRIKAERGADKEKKASRLNLDQGIVGYVARQKQLQNVGDVTQEPWSGIFQDAIPGTRSELAVPMMAGDILRGVLNVESSTPRQFDESDERLLEGLADLAVVALQNAERYDLVGKERQRFRLWYQARQELDDITDLAQLNNAYDLIARIAAEHSQSHAIIRRFDADTEELVMVYSSRPDYIPLYARINLNTGIGGQVARERRTIVIDDVAHLPVGVAIPQLSDTTARSLLTTPITLNEQYYGNLVLIHSEGSHFQKADREFFEGLAQELAATIYRLETTQERQEYAEKFRANEIMSSLGQVTFELTHQLGNDLGLVESYVDDIRQALAEQNAAKPVIMRKLETIVRMTRKVLDLSKKLKQELPRQTEQVTVPATILLEEALSQLSSPLPPNIHHELIVDGMIGDVRINYSAVADILRNLVMNAIEAMPGGGKLTLRAYNEGRYIALDVTDSGVGIPENLLPKIFVLSFSTKGSSGFGLWSARKNALDNYGDLRVKSCVHQGTTFTLLLPRVEKKIEEMV